MMRYFLVFRQK